MSFRTLTVAALAVSVLAMSLPTADAGHRRHGRHYHHHHHDNGAAAAIIGLGFGVIIGSMLSQPRSGYGYERYDEPVRHRYRPEPWTDEWYVYCDQKYKTFDPRTGQFRGYDGKLHYCR